MTMVAAPFSGNTLHVVIDMQRIFAEETAWHVPAIEGILPNIRALCDAQPAKNAFARFLVPQNSGSANGRWKAYYRRWEAVTLEALEPSMLDLVAPLGAISAANTIVDKTTYSVFGAHGFVEHLERMAIDTLVFSGVETDVCVYASVLDAVDLGYRVILAQDALGSGNMAAHDAVLTCLAPRLSEQIEILSTHTILNSWR